MRVYRFKLGLIFAAVVIIVQLFSAAPAEAPGAAIDVPASPVLVPASVVRVVDGDTIVCDVDGDEIKVRLIGIDTPETVHPEKEVEFYGEEASAYTTEILDGQAVYLEYDVETTDRYGRDLAYVWLKDGTLFNDQLVLEGYATVYTFPPNVKYVDRFTESARLARERGAGLYAMEP